MARIGRFGFDIREKVNSLIDATWARVPEQVAEHLVNSRTEFLKAVRAVIDDRITKTERRRKKAKDTKRKKTVQT